VMTLLLVHVRAAVLALVAVGWSRRAPLNLWQKMCSKDHLKVWHSKVRSWKVKQAGRHAWSLLPYEHTLRIESALL
jgi:hypothetical protein